MPDVNAHGGYAFIPGLRFASNGVAALEDHVIERAGFDEPVAFDAGFAAVDAHLRACGRPRAALCGVELRLPATLTLDDFVAFNDRYLRQLADWKLLTDGGTSPFTRTNVSPAHGAPSEPSVLAFSYTMPEDGPRCFVISGIAELPSGAPYPDGVVRRGETGDDALREKASCVARVVAQHIGDLGLTWEPGAQVHLYSAHAGTAEIARDALAYVGVTPAHGIVWHDAAAPPVTDLELEIDVRRYAREIAVGA